MPDVNFPIDEQVIAVVDVETTGLFPFSGDRVCEIGIVSAQGDVILDTYQTLVNPRRPISPRAARVNGLSDLDVCEAPIFAEIADQVLSRIEGKILVFHNAPFDLGFLNTEFAYLGRPWQPAGVIDTLDLCRQYYRFRSNSLSAVAIQLGVDTPQAHRALGDALTTFQIFRRIRRQLAGQNISQSWDMADRYLPETLPVNSIPLPPEIQEAMAMNKAVGITYLDGKGGETDRIITPIRVQTANDLVYMVAFCHLRQAERSFRLDRVLAIRKIE